MLALTGLHLGSLLGGAVVMESGLSVVGIGAPVPEPEWGALVVGGRPYLHEAWWISAFPCAAIVSLAFGLQLLGDALGDRFERSP